MGSFGRVHYVSAVFFRGKAGMILLGGFVTAVAVRLTRKGRPLERTLLSWALVDVVVTSLWLPVRWDSYLLIALAPLVLLGWIGYTVALREIAARLSAGSVVERSLCRRFESGPATRSRVGRGNGTTEAQRGTEPHTARQTGRCTVFN